MDEQTQDGHGIRRRDGDRRKDYGNCRTCPLNSEGLCRDHLLITTLNAKAHDDIDRGNKIGNIKLWGIFSVVIVFLGSLFWQVNSIHSGVVSEVEESRKMGAEERAQMSKSLTEISTNQTMVLRSVGEFRLSIDSLRDRVTKMEVELAEHRKRGE